MPVPDEHRTLFELEIQPRLKPDPESNEWWANLADRDQPLALRVATTLRAFIDDIDAETTLQENRADSGEITDEEFLEWERRAYGLRRVLRNRFWSVRRAEREYEAMLTAEARRENAKINLRQQRLAEEAREERQRRQDAALRSAYAAGRAALLDLTTAVIEHQGSLDPESASEMDALLWASLDRISVREVDGRRMTLRELAEERQKKRAARGEEPVSVLR